MRGGHELLLQSSHDSWHCPALTKSHFPPPSACDMATYFSVSRKRETRRVFLTPRLNLQFYYIPVVTEQTNTLAIVVSLHWASLGAAASCEGLTVISEKEPGALQKLPVVNSLFLEPGGWGPRQGSWAQFAGGLWESVSSRDIQVASATLTDDNSQPRTDIQFCCYAPAVGGSSEL